MALGLCALAAALQPHTGSMPRPRRGVANSRSNGSKASNKGKLKSEPIAIININYGAHSAAGGITFKKVLRAQLHKHEKYLDELRAEEQLNVAARVVRARYLCPGVGQRSRAVCRVRQRVPSWLPIRQPRASRCESPGRGWV